MQRIIVWFQSVRLRAIAIISALALALFINVALGFSNSLQAQAKPSTPEASLSEVDQTVPPMPIYGQTDVNRQRDAAGNSGSKLKNAADNIREKLNLDEPLPESTKEFFGQVKDKTDEVIKGK